MLQHSQGGVGRVGWRSSPRAPQRKSYIHKLTELEESLSTPLHDPPPTQGIAYKEPYPEQHPQPKENNHKMKHSEENHGMKTLKGN